MSLKRSAPLERKTPMRPTGIKMPTNPPKKKPPRRDWTAARAKIEEEGRCRVCRSPDGLQAAHTIGRAKQDKPIGGDDARKGGKIRVFPESVVPLCESCHSLYDARRLDLLPHLFLPEQVDAVEAAGGIAAANRRLSGAR